MLDGGTVASWPETFEPDALVSRLAVAQVDFVVVGGVAVIAQGYVRLTRDLDIVYARTQRNLDRLGDVLVALHARLRDVREDVPFVPDGRMLRRTEILTLATDHGWLDLLAVPAGAPPYADLRAGADMIEIADVTVAVASIGDLLAMKRAANRPRDIADIEALEAIARLRRP